jgi:hypothetical protein
MGEVVGDAELGIPMRKSSLGQVEAGQGIKRYSLSLAGFELG